MTIQVPKVNVVLLCHLAIQPTDHSPRPSPWGEAREAQSPVGEARYLIDNGLGGIPSYSLIVPNMVRSLLIGFVGVCRLLIEARCSRISLYCNRLRSVEVLDRRAERLKRALIDHDGLPSKCAHTGSTATCGRHSPAPPPPTEPDAFDCNDSRGRSGGQDPDFSPFPNTP